MSTDWYAAGRVLCYAMDRDSSPDGFQLLAVGTPHADRDPDHDRHSDQAGGSPQTRDLSVRRGKRACDRLVRSMGARLPVEGTLPPRRGARTTVDVCGRNTRTGVYVRIAVRRRARAAVRSVALGHDGVVVHGLSTGTFALSKSAVFRDTTVSPW